MKPSELSRMLKDHANTPVFDLGDYSYVCVDKDGDIRITNDSSGTFLNPDEMDKLVAWWSGSVKTSEPDESSDESR